MTTTRIPRAAFGLVALLLLSACSSGPSAGDMKQALQNNQTLMMQFSMMVNAGAGFGGTSGMSADEVMNALEFERGDCAEAVEQTGFVCDYRVISTIDGEKREGQWTKARFYNAGGWQIEQTR